MAGIRARLAWIAGIWLCCQLAVLTVAPVALVAGSHAANAIACTCIHGGHDACPMHHPAKPKPVCECRSTTDPDAAAIVSLLGPVAVIAAAPLHAAPAAVTSSPNHQIAGFLGFVDSPDGPPPRE